ncbi:hypothetical protein [Paenibacillus sp. L3-i20]|uniref:YphA family membrane protein n=1 Tax=Paenibacillus sp. L3-i20 TaxID=2905833 RepID=UPI001EDD1EF9|nr:hypothetical protein [Paenibacillus sp. L3-i20]GKU79562.1 hypothetical protein L3i20_v239590 [Paenibacillus sp. L3-i20]
MIPGYLTVLLMLNVYILFATGWKSVFAADIRTDLFFSVTAIMACSLLFPLWWAPFKDVLNLKIHGAACLLLSISAIIVWRSKESGVRGYLLLCILMLAMIMGSIKSLYSIETMFHWFESSWNASLIGGLICGIFTTEIKHQLAILTWGAALGEGLEAFFREGTYHVAIGTLSWWDGLLVALCIAVSFSLMKRVVRRGKLKLSAAWLQLKGGRSS